MLCMWPRKTPKYVSKMNWCHCCTLEMIFFCLNHNWVVILSSMWRFVLYLEMYMNLQKQKITFLNSLITESRLKLKGKGDKWGCLTTNATETVKVNAFLFLSSRTFDLKEALNAIGVQICSKVNRSLTERGLPTLNEEMQSNLMGQIAHIVEENNPVSSLIG